MNSLCYLQHFRHEFKYVATESILQIIEHRVKHILQIDKHAQNTNGIYSIRSLYFDDIYKTCYFENEDGTNPREKFRIRIYNCSNSRISLELKQKYKGMTHKISCPVSYDDCLKIMKGELPSIKEDSPDLYKKFISQMQTKNLHPVTIVSYERTPYVYNMGNVRVTFDKNIRSSNDIAAFFDPKLTSRPILEQNTNMMEVKYDELLPDYIAELLQTNLLRQTSFSKYYLCRKYCLPRKENSIVKLLKNS